MGMRIPCIVLVSPEKNTVILRLSSYFRALDLPFFKSLKRSSLSVSFDRSVQCHSGYYEDLYQNFTGLNQLSILNIGMYMRRTQQPCRHILVSKVPSWSYKIFAVAMSIAKKMFLKMNVTRRGQSDCETTCSLAQWLRPWAQHVVYRGQDIFHSLDNQVAIERPAVPSIWPSDNFYSVRWRFTY